MTGGELLQSKLSHWASNKGKEVAITETSTESTITFENLRYAVTALHSYLGDDSLKILVSLPGSIIDSVLWLSILTGGHLIIPVSPVLTDYEYEDLIKKHSPNLIIRELNSSVNTHSIQSMTYSDCEAIINQGIKEKIQLSSQTSIKDGSVFLSTSGSTGEPKGMILSATQITTTAENIGIVHRLSENDRGLTPLPFHHVNAPVVSLATSIITGSSLIIAPKFSKSNFWKWIEKFDPTWVSIVPTIVAILLQTERPDFLDNSSLRFMRTASAPLPAVNLKKFEEKFDIPLIETYGISEAASTIAANPVPPNIHKAGSVGLPLGVTMRICHFDEKTGKLQEVTNSKIGEICIKGPNVISHYEKGAGQKSFVDDWFRTGDLGYFDQDGYLTITGRMKEIIIRGGENISPREIEEVLLEFPSVEETAVVGQPDEIYGEQVVAFVVMQQKTTSKSLVEEIEKFARQKLSSIKVPSKIYILDALPRGKTGKIDKPSLRKYSLA